MRELPKEVLVSLNTVDIDGWESYLGLCRRFNIEPDEYISHIKSEYKFSLNMETPIIDIYRHPPLKSLMFLSGATLPNVKVINIYTCHDSPFDLSGLTNITLPKLKRLVLVVGETTLDELGHLKSESISNIHVSGKFKEIPNISLSGLKKLRVDNFLPTDMSFLNNCNLSNLRELRLINLNPEIAYIPNINDVNWGKYSKLKFLHLANLQSSRYSSQKITLPLNLPKTLKSLILSDYLLELNSTLSLPELEELYLDVRSLSIFKNLKIPNITRIFIFYIPNESVNINEIVSEVRGLLDDDDVTIAVEPYFCEDNQPSVGEHSPTFVDEGRQTATRQVRSTVIEDTEEYRLLEEHLEGENIEDIQRIFNISIEDSISIRDGEYEETEEDSDNEFDIMSTFGHFENKAVKKLSYFRNLAIKRNSASITESIHILDTFLTSINDFRNHGKFTNNSRLLDSQIVPLAFCLLTDDEEDDYCDSGDDIDGDLEYDDGIGYEDEDEDDRRRLFILSEDSTDITPACEPIGKPQRFEKDLTRNLLDLFSTKDNINLEDFRTYLFELAGTLNGSNRDDEFREQLLELVEQMGGNAEDENDGNLSDEEVDEGIELDEDRETNLFWSRDLPKRY